MPVLETPTTARLLEVVAGMAGRPVLMNVDLVADRFITGFPRRISREAPVLILEYDDERLVPGGGANAVANVAALGGRALPLGVVGSDDSGRALRAALADLGVALDGIREVDGYRTPTKTRILGGGRHGIKQQIVRYDIEDRVVPDVGIWDAWRQALAGWTPLAPRVVVLSDYGYGAVVPSSIAALRTAFPTPAIVLCDSRYRLPEFTGLTGASPNEEEVEAALGRQLGDDHADIARLGNELRETLAAEFLLITRGSRGMSLISAAGALHLPVHGTDQVADVTGAGDTVIGTLALALAAGATPLEAALLADYAGGVVVQKLGTATLNRSELESAVATDSSLIEGLVWDEF